jgi:hypothetical protein
MYYLEQTPCLRAMFKINSVFKCVLFRINYVFKRALFHINSDFEGLNTFSDTSLTVMNWKRTDL